MNTIRFNSKADFIAALEGRRKFWRDYDARQTREHRAAEQKWLAETRAALREALKWDYKKLSKALDWNGRLSSDQLAKAPACPKVKLTDLDRVIKSLNYTHAKVFNVDSQGAWSEAHSLLTWDPSAPTDVC